MIYTVTFNPAIDYVVRVADFKEGTVNRCESEEMFFGGKGINVSAVLAELGVESVALGFIAGFTGDAIEQGVNAMGIRTDFIKLASGNSRINLKLKSEKETEINAQGPAIESDALDKLFEKLDKLHEGDVLILAGSIPKGMPHNIYERILKLQSGKGVKTVVDASGALLMNVLKYKPFLVKPNNFELEEMFGVTLGGIEDIELYAGKLREMGAKNVLVSMAGDGALLLDENGSVHICGAHKGKVLNSVGAGDSMVAGFVAGSMGGDYEYALRLGTAAGGATAFSDGLATKEKIMALMNESSDL